MRDARTWLTVLGLAALQTCSAYDVVRQYSGSSFFDAWDFYGYWDNLTLGKPLQQSLFLLCLTAPLGDVWWLDRENATEQGLAYVNSAGNAIIKVDNTSTVPYNDKRNSVRITSNDSYNYGSVWIFDIVHLPFGCSVWPAVWTKGSVNVPQLYSPFLANFHSTQCQAPYGQTTARSTSKRALT